MSACASGSRGMKMEKPFNCSQEGDDVENPKTLSISPETFSDPNEDIEKRQHGKEDGEPRALNHDYEPLSKHSEADVVGVKSSIEMNSVNEPKDEEGSEYSSLKNEVAPGNIRLRCKVKNESIDGNVNTLEQPKTESSSSNSTNFMLSATSNDSYQESALDARTFKGSNTNNANTSSMSSTCTDLGYLKKEVRVSNMESGMIGQSKHSKEKLTDAPETNPYPKEEFFADMKVVSGMNESRLGEGEREESTLLGFDLNEDVTYSNEVEQQTAASCVKSVRKPIAIFAKCEGSVGESTPELGFKGLGKGGWKGSASTTSAFRPTFHFKGSKGSGQKQFEGFDLNVDASGMENEREFPIRNDASEGASSVQAKFRIDLNVASENEENVQSSRTVRDFNLNDDLTAPDPDVQEGIIPSFRKGAAIHDYETYSLRNAGGPEPRYVGPMFLPRMTSMPFMVRVPEQAEHAARAFPFHTPAYIEPRNPVFSLASSLDVPLYPAHLNGIPAFHGGPNLVEFRGGPGSHNVMKVGAPYNLYDGVNPPENATSGGNGMQVLSAPMHPMFAQQLNDFRQGGLLSLTPMKRKEPEVRWNPR